jgi:hypothetical protein
MQEEVESRTVNLAISTTKLSMRMIVQAGMMYLRHRKLVKDLKKDEVPSGKQSVQDLIGQKQGVSSIDIAKTDLRGFEGVARKYGVDYAIRKDASVDPPKYLVFFKAKALNKEKRPSVLKQLRTIAAKITELPGKVVNRDKKRELDR